MPTIAEKILLILLSIYMLIEGFLSLKSAINNGRVVHPTTWEYSFILRKLLGENGNKLFLNLLIGIGEICISCLIIYSLFKK
jgi:hypothetical protein